MDREKVIKALECLKSGTYCECCDYKPYDDCVKRVATDALALLKEQPDVVRCRDCIDYMKLTCQCNWPIYVEHDEFFCADGERKEQ